MEESSEKRRKRLQVMSMQASTQSRPLSTFSSSSSLQSFSNPLLGSSFDERTPSKAPRFDFYTDPMAAFSGSKRRNPHFSPESFSSPTPGPSPLSFPLNRPIADRLRNYHVPANLSPNQSPWRSPIQFQSPLSSHTGGTLPDYNPKFNPNSNPNSNSWNKSGDASPSYTHSPHSNSGRGSTWQSRGRGSSSRFVRSGGRGRGFSQDEPVHYYMKTMVKDPWRKLKPVVGNILVPRSGFGSWLPKSIAAPKRAKVVESGTKPLLSLAESLALSLDEALNDV